MKLLTPKYSSMSQAGCKLKGKIKMKARKCLSTFSSFTMTSLICLSLPLNTAHASDIEIYKDVEKGTVTLTLMLDTSGSMDAKVMEDDFRDSNDNKMGYSACDIPSNSSYNLTNEDSKTSPIYTRRYCELTTNEKIYYYRSYTKKECTKYNGKGECTKTEDVNYYENCPTSTKSIAGCTPVTSNGKIRPNPNSGTTTEKSGSYTYYYKNNEIKEKKYDRLTRLKDAIFQLMDSEALDAKTSIGIGQFSSQSNSANALFSADGRSGKILVPAASLTTAQKNLIKTEVAKLKGYNGTPTANAYAEVAAYMLGKTTKADFTAKGEVYIQAKSYPHRYYACTGGNKPPQSTSFGIVAECKGYGSGVINPPVSGASYIYSTSYYDYYVKDQTYSTNVYSGFDNSIAASINKENTANYDSPLPENAEAKCNGQGIYFLTDGEPNSSPLPLPLMRAALGAKGSAFELPATGTLPNGSQAGHGMPEVGEFAKALRDPARNPSGLPIRTAVVGFGSVFKVEDPVGTTEENKIVRTLLDPVSNTFKKYYNCNKIDASKVDARNACNWGAKSHTALPTSVGGFGEGGFYSAQSTNDVIDSVVQFVDEIKPQIESVSTGSATIPTDALYSTQIQNAAYYAQFDPKPGDRDKLWLGNMKKFKILNSVIVGKSNKAVVNSDGQLNDTVDFWAKSDSGIASAESISLFGGALSQLPVGGLESGADLPQVASSRIIYSNRTVSPEGAVSEGTTLKKIDKNYVSSLDPDRGYLLGLLGYNLTPDQAASPQDITETTLTQTDRFSRIGAVMHSRPVLLTQGGSIEIGSDGKATTENRKDYILFGSTQGVLHVVDADDGKEQFAFVPNEMIANLNQKNAFINTMPLGTNKADIMYGIDGQWVAHTEYVPKSNGELTVGTGKGSLKGKQWVYGGLRMGGRSYYSLDLSDLTSPSLKFHINPDAAAANTPLSYMGQSWSKPTLGWVNWKGKRTLVMFVGGGYDPEYEKDDYAQTNGKGAGVYMFNANSGELLWWASSKASTLSEGNTENGLKVKDMQYSVVSPIKTVDRNNDGLVDHLYFGDLGGQVFRVDIDNAKDTESFAKRAIRLLTLNTGATSPRFYEAPTFTIHKGPDGLFGVVGIGSGNRSKPLAEYNATSGYKDDAAYVIFDKDVARPDLYSTESLYTKDMVIDDLKALTAEDRANAVIGYGSDEAADAYKKGGWYYRFVDGSKKQIIKAYEEPVAIANDLYISVFDSAAEGVPGACGSGVSGESLVHRFCLPYGQCGREETKDIFSLGKGILGISIGPGSDGDPDSRGIVFLSEEKAEEAKDNESLFDYNAPTKLVPQRWYEQYANPARIGSASN